MDVQINKYWCYRLHVPLLKISVVFCLLLSIKQNCCIFLILIKYLLVILITILYLMTLQLKSSQDFGTYLLFTDIASESAPFLTLYLLIKPNSTSL